MDLIKSIIHFEIDAAGVPITGNIERIYSVTDVSGTYQRQVRDVLSAADLAGVLPDQGALVLQLQAAMSERDAAVNARDVALAEKAAASAERDALAARLAPQQAGGFPILTPVQMRRGLRGLGITSESVLGVIALLPDDTARHDALEQWEYALGFERTHPLIVALGGALGLDSSVIDAAWTAAAQ